MESIGVQRAKEVWAMSGITEIYLPAETVAWLTVASTLGAVVVAVGLQRWQWWLARRRRPSLSLSFDDERDRVDVPPACGEPRAEA
jgi:hypothetical protein